MKQQGPGIKSFASGPSHGSDVTQAVLFASDRD